jgi:hypothetical protein
MRFVSSPARMRSPNISSERRARITCSAKHCGVHPFVRGHIEQIGGDFVLIRLCTLDDAAPAELLAGPIKYFNGRDDSWWTEPEETRHL